MSERLCSQSIERWSIFGIIFSGISIVRLDKYAGISNLVKKVRLYYVVDIRNVWHDKVMIRISG